MQLLVRPDGQVRCIYDELIDVTALGPVTIQRASYVEPDQRGLWWADLGTVKGPRLGPFASRSQALAAETCWLSECWLSQQSSVSPE